jgi:hypothetical protein
MSAINTMSRRSFVSTVASLVAPSASFTMLPKVYAATGAEAHPSLVQGGHHTDDEMQKCIQLSRECHAMCTQTISHCLRLGGHHAAPDHIRLMEDCAQLCTDVRDRC